MLHLFPPLLRFCSLHCKLEEETKPDNVVQWAHPCLWILPPAQPSLIPHTSKNKRRKTRGVFRGHSFSIVFCVLKQMLYLTKAVKEMFSLVKWHGPHSLDSVLLCQLRPINGVWEKKCEILLLFALIHLIKSVKHFGMFRDTPLRSEQDSIYVETEMSWQILGDDSRLTWQPASAGTTLSSAMVSISRLAHLQGSRVTLLV